MSTSEYTQTDLAIQLAVPWFDQHFWLVPRAKHVEQLVAQGIARGLIWTAAELTQFLALDEVPETDRHALARLRARFGAEIVRFEPWTNDDRERPRSTALRCGHSKRWRSIHGVVICGICHPPADASLVAEWISESE